MTSLSRIQCGKEGSEELLGSGETSLSQVIRVNIIRISHIVSMYPCMYDVMRMVLYSQGLPPKHSQPMFTCEKNSRQTQIEGHNSVKYLTTTPETE